MGSRTARRMKKVHKLVAEAFIGPCPDGMEVRHFPDRSTSNNRLDNLSYGTRLQNAADRRTHGTVRPGTVGSWSVLSARQVSDIRRLIASGVMSQAKIAALYGVCPSTISNLKRRATYQEVP